MLQVPLYIVVRNFGLLFLHVSSREAQPEDKVEGAQESCRMNRKVQGPLEQSMAQRCPESMCQLHLQTLRWSVRSVNLGEPKPWLGLFACFCMRMVHISNRHDGRLQMHLHVLRHVGSSGKRVKLWHTVKHPETSWTTVKPRSLQGRVDTVCPKLGTAPASWCTDTKTSSSRGQDLIQGLQGVDVATCGTHVGPM